MAEVSFILTQGGIDSKKAEFKQYLEKTGAVDQLTKILVQLYEQRDKPQNPVEYVRRNIGGAPDVDEQKMQEQYERLQDENEKMKK